MTVPGSLLPRGTRISDRARRQSGPRAANASTYGGDDMAKSGTIRAGMGDWTFEPWDTSFYPEKDGVGLRHVLEFRHQSFVVPEFVALLRQHGVAAVYADHETYPAMADVTGDFVYARLQTGKDDNEDCYTPKALDGWAERMKTWA